MYFMVEYSQKTQYQCGSVLTVSRVSCKYSIFGKNTHGNANNKNKSF